MKKSKLLVTMLIVCVLCVLIGCETIPETPKTTQLATPVATVESNVVSWQAVENATEYEVFVNGVSVGRQKTLSFVLTEEAAGDYKVTVKALSDDALFTASNVSNEVTVTILPGKLLAPVVRVNNLTFSWAAISHAAKYEVYVDGELVATVTELSYTLVPTQYKTYSVQVKAVSEDANYVSSELSVAQTYVHSKAKVPAPVLEVDGEYVTWLVSAKVSEYEVYVDGELVATVTEGSYEMPADKVGTHSVYVKAISADPDNFDDNVSAVVSVSVEAITDLSQPVYVYSKNLTERLGKYVLGIADKSNYDALSPGYRQVLDDMMDNYLCNMPAGNNWTDVHYAKYAWKLEEVSYDMTKTWVHANAKVYRIRLADGMYLTVAKNNVIGSPDGDYVCESEYVENDIWQYWQFVQKEGYKNQYYIYSVGHGYDWGRTNDFLTDTSRNNGGAELYPMTETNENYFPYFVKNVEGATFAEEAHNDYSGNYVVSNFKNTNYYAPADDGVVRVTYHDATNLDGTEIWTLCKVEGKKTYKIKFYDGSYMCMKDYNLAATDEAGAQEFYVFEVAGLKNGFKICGALDSDFCIYTDADDGLNRIFCYSDTEKPGTVSRWWNSIAHRNDMGNYWIFTAFDGDIPVGRPLVTNADNVFGWNEIAHATGYEVYVNGELVDTVTDTTYTISVEEGKEYSVTVKAITTEQGYKNGILSLPCVYTQKVPEVLDFAKPVFAYNTHLEARYAKCALGIADASNYANLSDAYKETLDKHVDNYLCNMVLGSDAEADYAKYAWLLEEVTYDMTKTWVYAEAKVYRIRLVDGFYLTVAKNNLIGTGCDYVCESEFVQNDIWQYWQFVQVEGKKDTYYLYNLGHGYDWNGKNHFIVDSTGADGRAEFWPMDNSNADWFEFVLSNVEATFADVKHNDYSGNYVLSTLLNTNLYAPAADGQIKVTDHAIDAKTASDVWTLEKTEGKNSYKIKFADGKYLCMLNYDLFVTDAAGAQEFYVFEVAGVKNGFKICGALDSDFCIFNDGNDGLDRLFVYSDTGNGAPSRWWGSIDHRNDRGNYWVLTPEQA